MKNKTLVICIILLPFLIFFSCKKNETDENETEESAINKEYVSGPCKLVISIDKKEISIAESISMKIDVTVDKEYNIRLPQFGENLEEFKITDFYDPGQKLINDNQAEATQEYVLEPFLSGEYTIPVMKVEFWTDSEGPEDPHIIESEPITITVTSLLNEDLEELSLKDITNPVLPPPPDLTWIFFLITGIVLTGAGITVLIIWLVKKRQGDTPVITIPAHELAYRQLEVLVAKKHIDRAEYKLFYIGISTILRHYIENRFRLHAPEQTTEEFLNDLKNSAFLQEELKNILKEFLIHCDLVKFAEHVPSNTEIQKTFDTCKDFIMTTEDMNSRIQETDPLQANVAEMEAG